jgi:CRISPR-associated endonuclease/helicase Cas3
MKGDRRYRYYVSRRPHRRDAGYGRGFKTRPLHAGFLGQDSILVHDEAHLEPAFQELLTTIECEQK